MRFSIRPFLQHFASDRRFVGRVRYGNCVQPYVNGFGDTEAEVFERQRHLGEFAGIQIGTQLMARDLGQSLNLQHALCRYRSSSPFVDGLVADSQKVGELLNAAGFIDCFLDA